MQGSDQAADNEIAQVNQFEVSIESKMLAEIWEMLQTLLDFNNGSLMSFELEQKGRILHARTVNAQLGLSTRRTKRVGFEGT
jgi:hypothetical protein